MIYAAAVVDTDRRIDTISAASGAPNTPSTPRGLKSVYGDGVKQCRVPRAVLREVIDDHVHEFDLIRRQRFPAQK